jgi:hypothetical protein
MTPLEGELSEKHIIYQALWVKSGKHSVITSSRCQRRPTGSHTKLANDAAHEDDIFGDIE